jgi:S1-C subfamily serine protease
MVLWGLYLGAGPLGAQENLPQLIERLQPAVVTVVVYDAANKVRGQGSGFFINNEGHFITNFHVLGRAEKARIKTKQGRMYTVKGVVGYDLKADLVQAVVDLPAGRPHHFLKLSPKPARLGERVIVIGSPMGLEQTVSDGMVSGLRTHPKLGELVQITAPISPGSSGGPVVNMKGEVIAVAKAQLRTGQNINFAVPAASIQTMALGPLRPLPLRVAGMPPGQSPLPPRPQIQLPRPSP